MACPKHSPDHPRSTGTATSPGLSSHLPRRGATIETRSRGNPVSYFDVAPPHTDRIAGMCRRR